MASERWITKTFGDCAELVRDTIQPAEAMAAPYIGLEHIVEQQLVVTGHGTADDVTSIKSRFKKGDILFGKLRPYFRKVVIAPFDGVCSTDIWVVRPRDGIDRSFLFYWMASQDFVDESMRGSNGTKMPRAQWEFVSRIERDIPPLADQEVIGAVLGTIDNKIELNRRMNETLQAMVRALFKSWFVDFDPVRAKAEGRGPGLPKPIADLFPDSFEDSELGEIPKGWKARLFSRIAEVIGGGTPKTDVIDYWNGLIPWFSVADAPNESDIFVINTVKKVTQAGIENSAARILPQGTTIISARGTVGKVALVGVPMAINQSCYGLQGTDAGSYFIYFATRQLVAVLKQRSHGTVFDTITRDTLAGVEVVTPSRAELDAFEGFAAPIMERIKHNLHKSKTLADLRDTLLPKLISGELLISDRPRTEIA